MDGYISKIQRYCTKDGPGIRSTVFAVGCNLRCKWCSNPELIETEKEVYLHDEDEPIGKNISAEDLVSKLLRDKAFYDQSGGGVTFSGGEPVLQEEFFLEISRLLKEKSVHLALDTAGHFPWHRLQPLVEAVDLILYDIKVFDSNLHERYTGAENHFILENAKRIAEMKKPMIIRMILVPTINDNEEEIENKLLFIRSLGVARLDILKYHRLGAGKYLRLGKQEPMCDTPECTDEFADFVKQKALSFGLTARIGG
jgi:pyruvate formate lyase activating enzyme